MGGTSLSTGRAAQEAGRQPDSCDACPITADVIANVINNPPKKLTVECLDRPPALSSVSLLLNEAGAS